MKPLTKHVLTAARIALGVALLVYVLTVTDGWERVGSLRHSPWVLVALPATALFGAVVESIRR